MLLKFCLQWWYGNFYSTVISHTLYSMMSCDLRVWVSLLLRWCCLFLLPPLTRCYHLSPPLGSLEVVLWDSLDCLSLHWFPRQFLAGIPEQLNNWTLYPSSYWCSRGLVQCWYDNLSSWWNNPRPLPSFLSLAVWLNRTASNGKLGKGLWTRLGILPNWVLAPASEQLNGTNRPEAFIVGLVTYLEGFFSCSIHWGTSQPELCITLAMLPRHNRYYHRY